VNWFGKLLNRVTGWDRVVSDRRVVFTGRTAAGVYVDADNALKNATVWACIQYLTRTVGQLPWHAYLRDDKGNATVAATHPVDYLINVRPNPEMGSFTFRQLMLGHVLLRGNAYAEIQRDNRGLPVALWPLHPDRVCARRRDDGALYYEVWNSSGNSEIEAMDMYHVRGLGDGPVGYSVIAYAAQSIGWAQATEVFGSTFFGNGMNPSGVVTSDAGLTPAGLDELRKELTRLYAGPKGERTAILDAKMKYEKVSTTPNDGQFIETRQHQVEEICRWFGVPPHKVMHLLRATFSNIEHQSIEVVVDSVTPWARVFEQEADYKLFGAVNRQGYYTRMSMQALLRGDNASRIAFYKGMFELGMTINQILALEEMNGIGKNGDVSFVSNNVQTLKNAIEGKPVKTVPQPGDTIPNDAGTATDQNDPSNPQGPSNAILLNRA
jgi:HK97 family phage portal protein